MRGPGCSRRLCSKSSPNDASRLGRGSWLRARRTCRTPSNLWNLSNLSNLSNLFEIAFKAPRVALSQTLQPSPDRHRRGDSARRRQPGLGPRRQAARRRVRRVAANAPRADHFCSVVHGIASVRDMSRLDSRSSASPGATRPSSASCCRLTRPFDGNPENRWSRTWPQRYQVTEQLVGRSA